MCLDGDPSNPQPQPTPQPRPPQIPQPTPANVQRSLQSPISDLAAPATVDKVSTPSSTMRAKGSTIAERMRRFDSKPDVAKIDTKNEGSQMHRQSTDLKRRMNPFMRRDASGNPTGNQSETVPRGPQHQPDKTSAIASGDRARRDAIRGTRDTSWKTSSQRPPAMGDVSSFVLDTSRGDNEASNVRSGYGRRGSKYFEKGIKPIPDPIPPAGQIMCPQHGRKLKPKARAGPAIGGLDKGLNGAYIPSGRRIRHQVESTSPWFILANPLTKTEGTSVSPEPCVDCLAETEIKRREQSDHGAEAPMAEHGVGDAGLFIHDEHGSTTTEPGTPLDEAIKGPSIIGTADEHQTVNLPGAAVADARPHQIGTLVAADLGDMIDAIIIEHRGALEMVITNLKNGPPGRTEMDQLSNEMASVSDSLRSADTRTRAVLDHNQNFSIILDTPPEFLRSRTKSMPDLLDFVESAARELGVDLSRKQDRQPDRMEQPTIQIVASGDSHSTVSTPTAGGSNISLAPSSVRAASPVNAMTPFATPHDSPAGSPVLKASDGSGQKVVTPPDSTNISPSTVPPAPKIIQPDVTPAASVNASPDTIRPALDVAPAIPSQAVPTIEPSVVTHPSAPEEMMPVSIQPTTNAGDQPNNASTTSVQTIIPPVTTALPGGFPSTPVTESQPILPTMEAGSVTQPVPQAMVLPQATMDGSAPKPPSRIPSIKNLARTLTGPRKHLSATPTRAPWSRDSKAEWAAVKPSLVKEREKDLQDHLSTEARKSAS
ncbi:hypothetical protein MBLNU457_3745t1 [Dothideomycetes sp. NU457]